jgi:hypothetical protein
MKRVTIVVAQPTSKLEAGAYQFHPPGTKERRTPATKTAEEIFSIVSGLAESAN